MDGWLNRAHGIMLLARGIVHGIMLLMHFPAHGRMLLSQWSAHWLNKILPCTEKCFNDINDMNC